MSNERVNRTKFEPIRKKSYKNSLHTSEQVSEDGDLKQKSVQELETFSTFKKRNKSHVLGKLDQKVQKFNK